ncbi:MAG: hypothetical protein SGJ09_12295 [Phycisphaerae bacterium]|nr:hypothetical protein [Phycisphaerae bacterium]
MSGGAAGGEFVRGNVEIVRSTIARLAGRSVDVRIEMDAGATARAPIAQRGHIPPEVRDHPIVKLAADLFDAGIVDVTPLRREEKAAGDVAALGLEASSEMLEAGVADTFSGENLDV